ncbi:MAG: alcohol dehydrogenase catalytic domain-containing protein [Clostridium sp.]|nr:alcohol dehydrogenase catalytic domain-containing protein [Clostridium sp.]
MEKKKMLAGGKTAAGPGHFETFEVDMPEIKHDTDVLFRVTSVGMCGTDVSIYKWSDTVAKEYHPRLPLVIGHEMSGIVEAVGSAVTRFRPGDHVTVNEHIFCGQCEECRAGRTCICSDRVILGTQADGACTSYMVVRELNCFKVPDNVPVYAGSLAEPLSVAVHAIERLPVQKGEVAVVYGVGMIGLGVCLVLNKAGARVVAVGMPKDEEHLKIARDLGAVPVVASPEGVDNVLEAVRGFGKDWADAAYDCSGSTAGLRNAIEVVRPAGAVCEVGIPSGDIPIDVAGQLVYKEKTLIGSRAFYHSTWDRTMELMGESAGLLDKFITHKLPVERFAEAIDLIKNGEAIRAIIVPNEH